MNELPNKRPNEQSNAEKRNRKNVGKTNSAIIFLSLLVYKQCNIFFRSLLVYKQGYIFFKAKKKIIALFVNIID